MNVSEGRAKQLKWRLNCWISPREPCGKPNLQKNVWNCGGLIILQFILFVFHHLFSAQCVLIHIAFTCKSNSKTARAYSASSHRNTTNYGYNLLLYCTYPVSCSMGHHVEFRIYGLTCRVTAKCYSSIREHWILVLYCSECVRSITEYAESVTDSAGLHNRYRFCKVLPILQNRVHNR